jgi:cytochrome c-type biogenesis protein
LDFNPLTLGIAFGAGVLSFISPCCVPLVPAYLGYMTGMSLDELREARAAERTRLVALTVAFVLGLAIVFTLLGASASLVGQVFLAYRPLVLKLGGLLIVLFGLHLIGVFRLPFLMREKRLEFAGYGTGGPAGAFLMGAAFAVGWTPCIGPVLAGILALASQAQQAYQGMALLFVYSLGLGLPFVLAGLLLSRWRRLLNVFQRYAGAISPATGVLMLALGLLVFSGRLALVSAWATSTFGLGLAQ